MSNDNTPPAGDPPSHESRPNWGSAYPPPAAGGYPPPPAGSGYPPYPQPPKHPNATTSMVLGIVSVAGGVLCWLPLLIAPVAWIMGSKTVKQIDASQGTQAGRSEAMAGKVLGIIGTVLLILAIAGIVLLIVLTLSIDDFWDDDYEYYESAARALLGS